MVVAVGTLSTRGWAKTTKEQVTELFNHYTESGHSQSVIYRDNIKSYAFTLAQYYQHPELMTSQIETDLRNLFSSIFPEGVDVTSTWKWDTDSDVRYVITIALRVMRNGEWYDATRSVNVDKGLVNNG